MPKRIVTRPDFDGVICAVLLKKALGDALPVVWTQPNLIQSGGFEVRPDDAVANLPLSGPVALWFDHHVSNATGIAYKGLFRLAPSAAHLIYDYFRAKMEPHHQELVRQADKIDAAQLSLDEVRHPERYPYVLLSMSIAGGRHAAEPYCDLLVDLLSTASIEKVMEDPQVRQHCDQTVAANRSYEVQLKQHTRLQRHVSISDFRGLRPAPDGNRFLVYSLFPEACVNVKLYQEGPHTVIKLGHSIFNGCCRINIGKLLSRYGGGGHRGAGATRFPASQDQGPIEEIIDILLRNEPEE